MSRNSTRENIDPRVLPELLHYKDGKLFWIERKPKHFKSGAYQCRSCNAFNAKYAWTEAFTAFTSEGYKQGQIYNKVYLAHRVIFALHNCEWAKEIDHINGVRTDNRIENLRSVSRQSNTKNRRLGAQNKSGVMGVFWDKPRGKWRAEITHDYQSHHLGLFETIEEAAEVRRLAESKFGFHTNHGR